MNSKEEILKKIKLKNEKITANVNDVSTGKLIKYNV